MRTRRSTKNKLKEKQQLNPWNFAIPVLLIIYGLKTGYQDYLRHLRGSDTDAFVYSRAPASSGVATAVIALVLATIWIYVLIRKRKTEDHKKR